TVTAESDRKARQFIRRAHSQKSDAPILVTGCFAQTSADDILSIDGVSYVCGNANKLSVVDATEELLKKNDNNTFFSKNCVSDIFGAPFEDMNITKFDRTRAYVKIEDGCENRCTYCIIPSARGLVRSKRPEDVVSEVKMLTEGGCKEVVLTGIETASYGKDLENTDLADIISRVDKIEGIGRVRLGSLDPSLITDSFVSKIKDASSLAHHFHLSLQSGSDRVLALMKRKYNSSMAMRAIERLRAAFPEAQFTTDVIVGFPGETEEDFLATLEFARKARFLKIHIFPYSKREGTPAASMQNQLPKHIKHERLVRLSEVEAETRREILSEITSKNEVCDVLFETFDEGMATGHTQNFIEVCVPSSLPLHSVTQTVRLLSCDGNVCFGEILH
ncbi:MAG: tRNA (N(6)-L-threonylcarbamoyladenosine(37)-C(2))-methylthiotransferase MtaB, partial [Clostridia bacterium]|nr:tRNA (N(6)-L-threonylcarbamoyladenosine(37)-C(2))-methylthiotransferase MtaB [Clostridia bacterium]